MWWESLTIFLHEALDRRDVFPGGIIARNFEVKDPLEWIACITIPHTTEGREAGYLLRVVQPGMARP
ncbi:MAG: hypothetical protein GQ565_00670 [Candidatus Aegiribacteria sp.]|nr:hypothetical protein [Candidatus Aegiribacteria sp.]